VVFSGIWPEDLYSKLLLVRIIDTVNFLAVEPAHPGSSLRLGMGARIFLDLFQDLTALFFQW